MTPLLSMLLPRMAATLAIAAVAVAAVLAILVWPYYLGVLVSGWHP